MAFSTAYTNTCTYWTQPDPTLPAICTNYWLDAPAGQTTLVMQGLDSGCVYFTAYDPNDPFYVWPVAPTCDPSICQHDLQFITCNAQVLGPTTNCYPWYQAPPDGNCLVGNQEFTWILVCADISPSPTPTPSPTPSSSPGVSPSPTPSPTPTPTPTPKPTSPPSSKSGISTGAIIGIACGAVAIALVAIAAFIFFVLRSKKKAKAGQAGGPPGAPGSSQPLLPGKLVYGDVEQPPTMPGGLIEQTYDPNLAAALHKLGASGDSVESKAVPTSPVSLSAAGSGNTTLTGEGSSIITASSGPSNMDPLNIMGSGAQWRAAAGASRGPLAAWELRFEDIIVERSIGQGSWGHVYKGNWRSTPVAVKILLDSGAGDEETDTLSALMAPTSPILGRLEQEASIMTQMHHPNIVQFLGLTVNPAAVVTEFCARGSLTSCLQAGLANPSKAQDLTWRRRMSMAADCVRGMIYLHTRAPPIIHRDLKSPNLLVTAHWVVKVSDFNLSKVMQDATRSTSMQAMNPRWLAPEIFNGGTATTASDVFAFGVVMWELMTWQLPWASSNPWGIVSVVTSGSRLAIPEPSELPGPDSGSWPQLNRYLELMERCWAQDPESRPTFEEVMTELTSIDPEAAESDA